MKIIVNNVRVGFSQPLEHALEKAAKIVGIYRGEIVSYKIYKRSIDARRKNNINFLYSFILEIYKENFHESANVRVFHEKTFMIPNQGKEKIEGRPIIVGSGPAGLFCALMLSEKGYAPIVIERGDKIEDRDLFVKKYWEGKELDVESNIQFGEGGAGAYSDGKLTTRINDPLCGYILKKFVEFGAPEEILWQAKPHIGTDKLKEIVKKIRERIIENGGEFQFRTKLTDINIKNNVLKSVKINNSENIESNVAVLAIGHSARDTYEMLYSKNLAMESKSFSMGLRIEHPQDLINAYQYGMEAGNPILGASEYKLNAKIGQRSVYSFCVCPGGIVVGAASEKGTIVTNGMSNSERNGENANSALVVSVNPSDFEGQNPLSGIEFQRKWEQLAYEKGNGNAPIQRLQDFLNETYSEKLGSVKPTYTGETKITKLKECIPEFVYSSLVKGIKVFDNNIKGFAMDDAILTGVETRTSAPLRILRNEEGVAAGMNGIYPCGEGAGYAGGIVSAAVDGIKTSFKIIEKYSNNDV